MLFNSPFARKMVKMASNMAFLLPLFRKMERAVYCPWHANAQSPNEIEKSNAKPNKQIDEQWIEYSRVPNDVSGIGYVLASHWLNNGAGARVGSRINQFIIFYFQLIRRENTYSTFSMFTCSHMCLCSRAPTVSHFNRFTMKTSVHSTLTHTFVGVSVTYYSRCIEPLRVHQEIGHPRRRTTKI